ncbi:hypothetical protein [Pseudomonas sp. NW5]|uniref:hypothetical protein n=1 Tax=Pseudomonas sp. NW5 TaxID=2934934 RepID=UPI00202085E5|nr:hypothetical protein [Pseudomonas sp. NW5]MCL7462790.1 hypothetical protein [Pseudomonas sp. NW5]
MNARQQRGTLMLLILPLLPVMALAVSASLRTSDTQTRIVQHLQQHQQAESAAWLALMQQLATDWPGQPPQALTLDLDGDDQPDHQITLAAPLCLRADPDPAPSEPPASDQPDTPGSTTPLTLAPHPPDHWLTLWQLQASAHDLHQQARAEVQLIQRRRLPSALRQRLCPLPDEAPSSAPSTADAATSALDSAAP